MCEPVRGNIAKKRRRLPRSSHEIHVERQERLERLNEHRSKCDQRSVSVQTEAETELTDEEPVPRPPQFQLSQMESRPMGQMSKEEKLTLDIEVSEIHSQT